MHAHTTPRVELERVRSILRSVEIEATDARLLSSTSAHCVDNIFRSKIPAGPCGSDVFALVDDDRDVIRFNAQRVEQAVVLICSGIEEAARVLSKLDGRTVAFPICVAGKIPAPGIDPLHDLVTDFAADRALGSDVTDEWMEHMRRRVTDSTPSPTTFDGVLAALELADDELGRAEPSTAHALLRVVMAFLALEAGR